MTWTSHPHRIDYPTAIAWRGDGAALAVAGHEEVELIELAAIGSRQIDARFEDIDGVAFEGGELIVRDGGRRHRFDAGGASLGSEPDREPDDAPEVVCSASGAATLTAGDDGVYLVRGGGEPRWIGDRGPLGFAGERPIVAALVHGGGGDPRRLLRAGGDGLSPNATAVEPGGRIAFACDGAVHVVSPDDLEGDDPLPGLASPATDLAISADHVAACSDHELVVFERASGAVAARWHHGGGHDTRVGFLDPETLVIAMDAVELWRWRERRRVDRWVVADLGRIEVLRLARDRVLVAGYGIVAVLDRNGEVVTRVGDGEAWIRSADLHPSEPRIAVAFSEGPARVYGDDGAVLAELPASDHVALTGDRVWTSDYEAGRALRWPPIDEPAPSLDPFSLSARVSGGVLLGGDAGLSRYRDDGDEQWSAIYRDGVRALAGAPGSESLYTAGRSSWIAERRLDDGSLARVLPAGSGAEIGALAISADGHHLIAGDDSGRIAVWELGDRCKRVGLADSSDLAISERFEPGELGQITAVALGAELVALGDGVLRWKGPLIGDIGRRDPDRRDIDGDCLSADGSLVARTQWDEPIEIRSVDTGEVVARLPEPEDIHGLRLAFSPSGDRLLIADSSTATVWSVDGAELVGRLDVDRETGGAAFAGDGAVIVWVEGHHTAAGASGLLVRWDPETSELERWPDPTAAAPIDLGGIDGVCAAGDRALLWSAELGYLIEGSAIARVLPPHRARVSAAALSPSGVAATADSDGVIRVWDPAGALVTELCTTSDGSWWRSAPEFFWEPSSNLAEGRW